MIEPSFSKVSTVIRKVTLSDIIGDASKADSLAQCALPSFPVSKTFSGRKVANKSNDFDAICPGLNSNFKFTGCFSGLSAPGADDSNAFAASFGKCLSGSPGTSTTATRLHIVPLDPLDEVNPQPRPKWKNRSLKPSGVKIRCHGGDDGDAKYAAYARIVAAEASEARLRSVGLS